MFQPERVREHMPVVGQDEREVGVVDHLDGPAVKLVKDTNGQHHWIPTTWISLVDEKVRLDRPSTEVRQTWFDQPPSDQQTLSSHH
jgi:hypothetical protein